MDRDEIVGCTCILQAFFPGSFSDQAAAGSSAGDGVINNRTSTPTSLVWPILVESRLLITPPWDKKSEN